MKKRNISQPSRLEHNVYLTATDTLIGFVSQNRDKLNKIKRRSAEKRYITALPSLSSLKLRSRIPAIHRNLVRRSCRTTFILPDGDSYRIIRDKHHNKLIKALGWAYTTSANIEGKVYDEEWAKDVADVVMEPLFDSKSSPSKILRLGKVRYKKIR